MSKRLQHIEDFVRAKLGLLEGDSQPDWMDFERKLRRANRARQMKRVAGLVGVILLLGFSQTFISGDGLLRKPSDEVVLELNTTEVTNTNKVVTRTETSPKLNQALGTIPTRQTQTSTISQDSKPKLREESSRQRMAAATPQTGRLFAAVEPSRLTVDPSPMVPREAKPQISSFSYTPELSDLPPGQVTENGEVVGEAEVPFDYVVPTSTFGEKDLQARDPDFLKYEAPTGPYISPLQEKKPWSYSLNLYPNFAFREFKIDPTKRRLLHSDFIDAMQHSERSGVNLNLGFEISRRIGPIAYFNTGIEYINNSYNAEYDFVNFRNANFDGNGEIINYTLLDDPQRITFNDLNSFHFLNFPASISYQPWATDHLRINLEFGFSLLYFLEARGSTIDYRTLEQIDLSERSYRKYMASSSLKIGLQYYLSPNMNIGFEPTLMYFTNSIYTEEYPFEVIPYSMGLNVNLQMKLQ